MEEESALPADADPPVIIDVPRVVDGTDAKNCLPSEKLCVINDDNKKEENAFSDDQKDNKATGKVGNSDLIKTEPQVESEDARSFGDLDSIPVGDESTVAGAGSDSGVEGCGRALSSGGGSRSCASSVISCGSACGSESSSLTGAPPRPRRRVAVTEPQKQRSTPIGTSTPRPVTAARAPHLATRERARSREKPTPPEKPRPLTPKPRLRPTTDLPALVRESPALRAKPTKTSTARCRTPSSPTEEKRWPTNGARLANVTDVVAARVAADKYGTLPRRRREADPDGSPRHGPVITTLSRANSARVTSKTKVRIYAEKCCQTVLCGCDIEAALGGREVRTDAVQVTRCNRGVQASARDVQLERALECARRAEHEANEERARRQQAESQASEERAARLAAHAELERNSLRLLELAAGVGTTGAKTDSAIVNGTDSGTEVCLRALDEQLRAAAQLTAQQRYEIDQLRAQCGALQLEALSTRQTNQALEARLREAERDAIEMQEFLAAETGALGDSLREAENELAKARSDLERRRAECRQLVRMCEQRRQEALAAVARARAGGGAAHALDALARRLRALTEAVAAAYQLPREEVEPTVFHNDAFSRSDSGEALSTDEPPRGGLLATVARAFRTVPSMLHAAPVKDDDRSRMSDDNECDHSADLLDSETEPCLVTDADAADEWWGGTTSCGSPSGADAGCGAWSGEELSPVRDETASVSASERECESLRSLSAAIAHRQRSEAAAAAEERGSLLERVLVVDNRLNDLLRALRLAASAHAHDPDSIRLACALRDKLDITEKNVADVVVKKLAELEASKNMMEQYRQTVENLERQLALVRDEDLDTVEEELSSCCENERRERYKALDAAVGALNSRQRVVTEWPRLAAIQTRLERLAFAIASLPHHTHTALPVHPPSLPTTA